MSESKGDTFPSEESLRKIVGDNPIKIIIRATTHGQEWDGGVNAEGWNSDSTHVWKSHSLVYKDFFGDAGFKEYASMKVYVEALSDFKFINVEVLFTGKMERNVPLFRKNILVKEPSESIYVQKHGIWNNGYYTFKDWDSVPDSLKEASELWKGRLLIQKKWNTHRFPLTSSLVKDVGGLRL